MHQTDTKFIKPGLRIGKGGLTEGVIKEINIQLNKKKVLKIRLLKTAHQDSDEIIKQVLEKTRAQLLNKVGFSFTIQKSQGINKRRTEE
ncbi:MAG: YhbY family RNA-binding protein [Candidatus Woesearchaeota archaeon]